MNSFKTTVTLYCGDRKDTAQFNADYDKSVAGFKAMVKYWGKNDKVKNLLIKTNGLLTNMVGAKYVA